MKAKKQLNTEMSEQPRITIGDVARVSGVSIATVSRVLKGQTHYISVETKDKVLHAAQVVGYVPHRRSPEAVPASTLLIGMTSVVMSDEPYTSILEGVTEGLHAHNARPIVCPIPRRHNCNVPLLERLMQGATRGGLILGSAESDEALLEALEKGFPCVVIYPDQLVGSNIPTVASANWNGAKTATEYLIELGHTRIGTITCPSRYISRERFNGFQSAMFNANLPILPELVFESEGDGKEAGYAAGSYFLTLPEPPTAIFSYNDIVATGILKAAYERGIAIPEQLSMIGFDDLTCATLVTPELTTVRQPFSEMGRVGVDMLMRLIEGRKLDVTRVELTARLIPRASTAPLVR